MDRLTIRVEGETALGNQYGFLTKNNDLANLNIGLVADKLGAYEDTGLTPEQITEIDKLYAEKCKELSGVKRNLPPCNISDRIWVIDFNKIRTGTVIGLRLGRMMEDDEEDFEGCTQEWYIQIESDCMSMSVPQSCIGETIFLSYEAAIKWFTETED